MLSEKKERRRYRVLGRVQGVGFRLWTLRRARKLGLSGQVRNEPDGSVTVEAEGPATALDSLEAALASGPPFASVSAVELRPAGDTPLPSPFDVAG